MKKRTADIFGSLGGVALMLAVFYISRDRLFGAFAFCSIAVLSTYIFLIYTQSKLSVITASACHIVAIVALYYADSMLALSIPYILLPFIALLIRNIWMEKLGHTLRLWIEPCMLLTAIALYALELKINPVPETDAKVFPLVFFMANGFMVMDVFYDGLKIQERVKKSHGFATGDAAPLFCLQNEQGEQVCLNDFKGKHNVLLLFVRGEWCPMCHIMLRTYMKESAQFRAKNIFLLVIGPDPTGVNKKMAEDLKLDFHILADTGLSVTNLYRLKIKAGHLFHANYYTNDKEVPLPASFLVDKNGVIRYCSHPEKTGEIIKLADILPILQTIDEPLTNDKH